jgi:hypothetical protein
MQEASLNNLYHLSIDNIIGVPIKLLRKSPGYCNHSFLLVMSVFYISDAIFQYCTVSVTGRKGYKLK